MVYFCSSTSSATITCRFHVNFVFLFWVLKIRVSSTAWRKSPHRCHSSSDHWSNRSATTGNSHRARPTNLHQTTTEVPLKKFLCCPTEMQFVRCVTKYAVSRSSDHTKICNWAPSTPTNIWPTLQTLAIFTQPLVDWEIMPILRNRVAHVCKLQLYPENSNIVQAGLLAVLLR